MHFRLRHVLNICFGFLEISQSSFFCFSSCHLKYIFNICFRKFNTCCWKKSMTAWIGSTSLDIMFKCNLNVSFETILQCIPLKRGKSYLKAMDATFVMLCAIWHNLYNLKNVNNAHWRVLLLVKLQAKACNFTKSNTPPWAFFTFLKLYKWYQVA